MDGKVWVFDNGMKCGYIDHKSGYLFISGYGDIEEDYIPIDCLWGFSPEMLESTVVNHFKFNITMFDERHMFDYCI